MSDIAVQTIEGAIAPPPRKSLTYKDGPAYVQHLQAIDRAALETPRGERLFVPTLPDYLRLFDLDSLLSPDNTQVVWDIGCGPKGKHLVDLGRQYAPHQFVGVSPTIISQGDNKPQIVEGVVEELDSRVLPEALKSGIKPPTTVLVSNVLRHVEKTGQEPLDRSLKALCNVLPNGGKICIVEDLGAGPYSEGNCYASYADRVRALRLPFQIEVRETRGHVRTRLELTKVVNAKPLDFKHVGEVSPETLDIYFNGELITPMSPLTSIPILYQELSDILAGKKTMQDYVTSRFDQKQIEAISERTTLTHAKKGIPFIIKGYEGKLEEGDLTHLQEKARELIAMGVPKVKEDGYRYDESLGVFVINPELFDRSWEAIREKDASTILNYIDGLGIKIPQQRHDKELPNGQKSVITPENTLRMALFLHTPEFSNDASQLFLYLKVAADAVSSSTVVDVEKIDGVVTKAWQQTPESSRISEGVKNKLISDLTGRVDTQKDR